MSPFLAEIGQETVSQRIGALRLARQLAREILESQADPILYIGRFSSYWRETHHGAELADLGNLDDYLSWKSREEVAEIGKKALQDFLGNYSEAAAEE